MTEKRWYNFTENGTRLQYRNTRNYTFSKELTERKCPTCDPYNDQVMVPNLLFQVFNPPCFGYFQQPPQV